MIGSLHSASEVEVFGVMLSYWFGTGKGGLVRTPWAQATIPRIANELLRVGTLNAEQIAGLVG